MAIEILTREDLATFKAELLNDLRNLKKDSMYQMALGDIDVQKLRANFRNLH